MSRLVGVLCGVLTHVLFVYTVCGLYVFLEGRPHKPPTGRLWIDFLLCGQFAVLHSLLLLPSVRSRLSQWIPSAFYGLFFCVVTCGCLLLTFYGWQESSIVIWQFHGAWGWAMRGLFWGTWGALLYSLHLTGLGYQTGLTPWWHWVCGRKTPRRTFEPRGLYRWFRHPVYLSFMGLLWFTPTMTLDHAILTGVWTWYIFVGSYLKDRRLVHYVGEPYQRYQAEVAGYPGMLWGPLARVPQQNSATSPQLSTVSS